MYHTIILLKFFRILVSLENFICIVTNLYIDNAEAGSFSKSIYYYIKLLNAY